MTFHVNVCWSWGYFGADTPSYDGVDSSSPSTSPGGQHLNTKHGTLFKQILKKVLNFLVAKLGYQQPQSGSPSKFQMSSGYRPTVNKFLTETDKNVDTTEIVLIAGYNN